MAFLLGFPVDSGSPELSFVVLVRTIRAKYHWCSGGSKSELRPHSGAKFAFEHAPREIQDQCRFEFEPIPPPPNKKYNKPDQLCNVGYSDAAACALAIAQYQPSSHQPIVYPRPILISCTFAPNHQLNQGFEELLLDKVTHEDEKEAKESLCNKWKAANSYNALALVLHEEDAQLLMRESQLSIKSIPLQKDIFQKLSQQPPKEPPIIYCKTAELPFLAEALHINPSFFQPQHQPKTPPPVKNSLFYTFVALSITLYLTLAVFTYLIGKSILSKKEGLQQASLTPNTLSHKFTSQKELQLLIDDLKDKISYLQQDKSKKIDSTALLEKLQGLSQKLARIQKEHFPNATKETIEKFLKLDSLKDPVKTESISLFIRALSSSDPIARMYGAWALGKIGPTANFAIPPLIQALHDESEMVRNKATFALSKMGTKAEEAVSELRNLLQTDKSYLVRVQAALALGNINRAEAMPELLKALADPEAQVRSEAIIAIGKIGAPQEAIPIFIKLLKDRHKYVCRDAAWILGEMGPTAKIAIPALIEALEDESEMVRNKATFALGVMEIKADNAVKKLRDLLLKDKSSLVRVQAALALGNINRAEAMPELLKALADPEAQVRSEAIIAIGKIGTPQEAIPIFIKLLKDQNNYVRRDAAWVLGNCGLKAKIAFDALLEANQDGDPEVRHAAKEAFEKLAEQIFRGK